MAANLKLPKLEPTGKPLRQRILVYRFGQIGDTVAALPALWMIRKRFPEAEIALLSEIPAKTSHLPPETVLPAVGLVDRFEKYPAGGSLKNLAVTWSCIRRLRREGFETLVYLVPSQRPASSQRRDRLFFKLAGIQHIWAANGFPDTTNKYSNGVLRRLPKEADALLARLQRDGFTIPAPDDGCMDLALTEAEKEHVRAWLAEKTGKSSLPENAVAVGIGGKTSTQLWPVERYKEVIRKLIQEHGIFPVVIGGPEELEVGDRLVAEWGTGLNGAGVFSVRASAALMGGTAFYLGNDTGTLHLAAAVGRPCVGIFSARNWPGIWEPYGKQHHVLRFDVPCSGCNRAVCNQRLECLTNIPIKAVTAACLMILQEIKIQSS